MTSLWNALGRGYHHVVYEMADPRFADLPLVGSPVPLILILAAYLVFVTSLGPRLMRNRPAFDLRRVIQAYDVIQVVLNLYIFERTMSLAWLNDYSLQCEPVNYSMDPKAVALGKVSYLFFLMKLVDLLDTVFFVLRKKKVQVTFLHVYHHAMIPVALWITVKYIAGGHATLLGTLNSLVHVVMYSYYLVTSLYPEQKNNIWWKKYITQLQLTQFVILGVHNAQMVVLPGCGYPKLVSLLIILPQNAIMIYFFAAFYRTAYWTQPPPPPGRARGGKAH